jgi:hypothetical protein
MPAERIRESSTVDQFSQRSRVCEPFVSERNAGCMGAEQGCVQPTVRQLPLGEASDDVTEGASRLLIIERRLKVGMARGHFLRENGEDELISMGEVPIEGRHADIRSASDLPHREVQALIGECGTSGLDDAQRVGFGIHSQFPSHNAAYLSHLMLFRNSCSVIPLS